MFTKKQLGVAVAVAGVLQGGQALAETKEVQALRGSDFQLEEVMVTARKKVENLQSVPVAIDALTQDMLDEKAITTLEDVAQYSPSLTFEVGVLPNDTRPVIRGMNISRGRPNVAILVDGIDVSSETMTVAGGGTGVNIGLLDLERVEVIKGPQSVTYGRSAFAGAVNYVTRRPQPEDGFTGYIEGEGDEHGFIKGIGNITFPVTDSLAMGVTLLSSDFDGYYENPNTGDDLGGIEQDGAAISLNFLGEGSLTAYARAEYSDDHYASRALISGLSLTNTSSPFDFFQLGSLSDTASNLPIPGGAGFLPESSQAECDAAMSFTYLYGMPPVCASMLTGAQGEGLDEDDIDLSPNPLTGRDFDGTNVENLRVSLELDWDAGPVQVISLTGYNKNETTVEEDFDLTNFELESLGPGSAIFTPGYIGNPLAAQTQFGVNTNTDTTLEYEQFSQEFRFTGVAGDLEWMADLLYWTEDMDAVMNQMWWARESMDTDYWNSILSQFVDPTCAVPGDVSTCFLFSGVQEEMVPNPIPMERQTDHWSIAASFTYNIGDDWRVTAEGRYLKEDIEYTSLPLDTFIHGFLNMPYFDPNTGSFVPVNQKEKVSESEFVPRISADWQITDDIFAYASAGKGFKPGGIATTDGNGDISTGHYEPEKLWAYELGFKSNLLGNRLRLNGAVFYNDYTDQQVPFFVTNSVGVSNVSITNAGESEVVGLELEAIYRPSANWTFLLGYTLAETEFKDFNISDVGTPGTYDKVLSGNEEGDFSGRQFANTPEDVVVGSIRYDGQFSGGWNYFTELFANYQSKRYLDQGNLSYLPAVTIVEFSAGLSSDNWRITAYVDNLTDEDDVRTGLGNVSYGFMPGGQTPPFSANLTLPAPRTFGLRARYMF